MRHTAPRNDPLKAWSAAGLALIALLHLFHGLLGVVLRIEGADQVHLASGLVAEHLATLAVIADIKLLGESRRSERRYQNCCEKYFLIAVAPWLNALAGLI